MYGGGSLPLTGAGLTLMGTTFGLSWMVAGAVATVLVGVAVFRWGTRGRKYEAA